MTTYLCISVTLLDRRFHGKADHDANHPDGRPEWPPSPMRLFQALLAGSNAGYRTNQWSQEKKDAYCWLEQLEPPMIIAPRARSGSAITTFVPDNDSDKKFERRSLLTAKRVRASLLIDGDTLHFVWPIDEAAKAHAEILCREARYMIALGWGIDQVVGNGRILDEQQVRELEKLGECWRPCKVHRPTDLSWRVPIPGSLDQLHQVYKSFLGRIQGRRFDPPLNFIKFDTTRYLQTYSLPTRSYAVFELPELLSFRQTNVAKVAAMVRSLVCRDENRNDFQDQFPTDDSAVYLAGHVRNGAETPPRFSYLPLPSIGHRHADGHIRRVLIAEPYGGDGAHARWAQGRLCNQLLRDRHGHECGRLLRPWRRNTDAMVDRYVRESRTWLTVTPVVLPGFDDGKYSKAVNRICVALHQAGLPHEFLMDVYLQKAPFWSGSEHPAAYSRPAYLNRLPGWHVRLRFRKPVPGPVAIGAGRHCGLGLFAASDIE